MADSKRSKAPKRIDNQPKKAVSPSLLNRGESTPFGAMHCDVTFSDKAYAQIEEMIVTLQLPPGTVLSELALANRLGIGRTPIREALQRLSRDGLVNILPRRGVLVSDIDIRAQLRVLEVRRELDRLLARSAATRATQREQAQFSALAAEMRQAAAKVDDIAFMRLDKKFNTLVLLVARNEFAARAMGLIHGLSRRFWYQHYKRTADLPLAARLHAEVAEAVAAQAPDDAATASDRLVDYIESFARSTL